MIWDMETKKAWDPLSYSSLYCAGSGTSGWAHQQ
jgi:hypothetical protein